jgi:hypothetical protein
MLFTNTVFESKLINKAVSGLVILFFLLNGCSVPQTKNETLKISIDEYKDRVKAMWLGQLVAVHMGWDFEHSPSAVRDINGYSEDRLTKIMSNGGAQVDDDWYYEMVALKGFEKYGANMTVEELGQQWLDYNMGTWGSAFYTRQALMSGFKGADAGNPRNNRMWFTVGNQNRSDLYAMFSLGMSNLTASISRELGHVNSYAEGTDGGILMGVMESTAFFEKDVKKLIKKAINVLDPSAPHRQCFEMIIEMGEAGKTWQETAKAVEERWGIEYPGTNSAVWNAGFAGVALWFGEGDFWKSVNIAYQASDFSDADCQAANVATILGAMHGTKIFPEELVKPFNNRITGENLGFMKLIEPVDENLDSLTNRTVNIALEVLLNNGAKILNGIIEIPIQTEITTLSAEAFHPNEFTKWWNPDWQMERAGFGAPGGGVRGVRGGTFLDGEILATYPRDEIRGVKIYRTFVPSENQKLSFEVAADPGRKWILSVYLDNKRMLQKLIDGGEPLNWPDISPLGYPQPLHEYEVSAEVRKWENIEIDLSNHANRECTVRLYQSILVRNGFPGNAYWKNIEFKIDDHKIKR